MIKYPVVFYANAEAAAGIHSSWIIESQNIKHNCAIPQEFEGPGGELSREDLFTQALTSCFVATFKVYAEKSKLQYSRLTVKAELDTDLDENKRPIMKKCVLRVFIAGCEKPDRIKSIAEKAFASGFILNSVKTELKLHLEIA